MFVESAFPQHTFALGVQLAYVYNLHMYLGENIWEKSILGVLTSSIKSDFIQVLKTLSEHLVFLSTGIFFYFYFSSMNRK